MNALRNTLAFGFALLLAAWPASHAGAAEIRLRILQTTDVHMNLLDYDYYQDKATDEYGLARTITLIRGARAEARNSLLFDNGDLLQGSPLGDYVARIRPLLRPLAGTVIIVFAVSGLAQAARVAGAQHPGIAALASICHGSR
jgi:2',3'-cyclic-nucleotide 2'-phosphodiesterase (5'-nucleotidase family)